MSDKIKEMNNEIKINKANKSITFINNGIAFSQFGIADEVLDLITNLQQAVKDTKDSYNDMLYELKEELEEGKRIEEADLKTIQRLEEENERLKEYYEIMVQFNQKNLDRFCDYKSRVEKAIELIKEAGCYDEDTKNFNDDIWDELYNLLNILQNGSDNE